MNEQLDDLQPTSPYWPEFVHWPLPEVFHLDAEDSGRPDQAAPQH